MKDFFDVTAIMIAAVFGVGVVIIVLQAVTR